MKERDLYRCFREAVSRELPNSLYWKIPDTKGLGGQRFFDALLIYEGRAYCIEFKVGTRKLEPHQKYWLARAQKAGAHAVIVTDKSWREFLNDVRHNVPRILFEESGGSHACIA